MFSRQQPPADTELWLDTLTPAEWGIVYHMVKADDREVLGDWCEDRGDPRNLAWCVDLLHSQEGM